MHNNCSICTRKAQNVAIYIDAQSLETGKPAVKQSFQQRKSISMCVVDIVSEVLLPKALELTMLGLAAGGGMFSLRNGSTRFPSDQTGYPLIFP